MLWAILAILVAFIWAALNITDKFIITKWVREPFAPLIIFSIVGLISSIFIYIFQGFSYLSFFNIFLTVLSGTILVLTMWLYFKALKIEEVSRVIPMFYFSPFFTLILAALFLNEIFTPVKYIGILLVVFGSIFLSSGKVSKIRVNRAFWLMILCTATIALNSVITKYLLNFADYWTVFGYGRIGTFLASIPLFYFYMPDLISSVRKHGKKVIGVITLDAAVNIISNLILTIAISIGFVTLINALTSLSSFFVLLIATFLTIFYPNLIKERLSRKMFLTKLVVIAFMFLGIVLII